MLAADTSVGPGPPLNQPAFPSTVPEAVGMSSRRPVALVLAAVVASMGASYRTTNFVVHAPNAQVAQQVGQWAEHYRRTKALEWLGQEMPTWPQPCPLI